MREVIPNRATPDRPPYVVEYHEAPDAVTLEADGVLHWLASGAARRIARAMLQATARVERAAREAAGDVAWPEGDLPGLT